MNLSNIDFDRELGGGREIYNGKVGHWWKGRSCQPVHAYAYRNIADNIAAMAKKKSPVIIDYACGLGDLLIRLVKRFPHSELFGIDGSPFLLNRAKTRVKTTGAGTSDRLKFIQTNLPDFSLPQGIADIVVFNFPHIMASEKDLRYFERRYKSDARAAEFLAAELERTDPDNTLIDEDFFESSLIDRVIGRNIRGLLKKGGVCVRVDYAQSNGVEPTELDLHISGFEDGTDGRPINGAKPEVFFKLIDWNYFRSKVILDVFHQTKDKRYRKGGYYITLLKAV